ncbi:MAG: hypothetical protein QOE08_736 [Thermoleophilaceae bacterium]|jgi:hypothetical protein|nr:hypothetical protein [Thermoleophilaceae bacterium]
MTGARTTRVLAAAVVATVAVTGCGSSNDKKPGKPIPSANSAALINRLEEAKRRSDPFRCNDLRKDTIPALERDVQALPSTVDAGVRSTVEDGISHLSQLVDDQCASQQQNTQTNTTPTTPTPTQTTPTPTQTQTTPPPTTPTQTTPTPTTPTPGNGGATPGNGGATSGNGKPKKDTVTP